MKAKRGHLIISLGIKNREQNLRKHVFKVVCCGGQHGHTTEEESVYQTNATVYLKLYENSETYGRRVITSVIANPFIEKKR